MNNRSRPIMIDNGVSLNKTPPTKAPRDYYTKEVTCQNCGFTGLLKFPRGTGFRKTQCPECGCRKLKDQRDVSRDQQIREDLNAAFRHMQQEQHDALTIPVAEIPQRMIEGEPVYARVTGRGVRLDFTTIINALDVQQLIRIIFANLDPHVFLRGTRCVMLAGTSRTRVTRISILPIADNNFGICGINIDNGACVRRGPGGFVEPVNDEEVKQWLIHMIGHLTPLIT